MDHKERLKRAVEYAKKEGSFSKINMAEKADIVCAWGVGKFFQSEKNLTIIHHQFCFNLAIPCHAPYEIKRILAILA